MTTHERLVAAVQAHVAEHGGPDTIVELLALSCFSVIAWHGLSGDPTMREHGEAAAESMGTAVEALSDLCVQRRMRLCN
jgi:hypothetical protein